MLTKLLAILDEGRAYSQQELAECLGVPPGSVAAQMEYLERLGLLRRINNSCGWGSGCKSCGSNCDAGCHSSGVTPLAMWELVPVQKEG